MSRTRWALLLLGLAGTLSVPGYCLLCAVHRPPLLTPTLVHHTVTTATTTTQGSESGQRLSRAFIESFKERVLGRGRDATNASSWSRGNVPFQGFPNSSAWSSVQWDASSNAIIATVVHQRLETNVSTVAHYGLVQRFAVDGHCFLSTASGTQRCPPEGNRWRPIFSEPIPRVVDAIGQSADQALLFVVCHRVLARLQSPRRWLRLYTATTWATLPPPSSCSAQFPNVARPLSPTSCEIPLDGALPILALDYDSDTQCLHYTQEEDTYTFRSLCFAFLAPGEVRWGNGPVGPFLDRRALLSDLYALHSYRVSPVSSGVLGLRLTRHPQRLQLATFCSRPPRNCRPSAQRHKKRPTPLNAANISATAGARARWWLQWWDGDTFVDLRVPVSEASALRGLASGQSADRSVAVFHQQGRLVVVDLRALFGTVHGAAGGSCQASSGPGSGSLPFEVVDTATGEEGTDVGLLSLFGLDSQPHQPTARDQVQRLAVDRMGTMIVVVRGTHAHIFVKGETPEAERGTSEPPSTGPRLAWAMELKVSSNLEWGPPKAISDAVFASRDGADYLVVLFDDGLLATYNLHATETFDAVVTVLFQQYQVASCLFLIVLLLLWSDTISSVTVLLRSAQAGAGAPPLPPSPQHRGGGTTADSGQPTTPFPEKADCCPQREEEEEESGCPSTPGPLLPPSCAASSPAAPSDETARAGDGSGRRANPKSDATSSAVRGDTGRSSQVAQGHRVLRRGRSGRGNARPA